MGFNPTQKPKNKETKALSTFIFQKKGVFVQEETAIFKDNLKKIGKCEFKTCYKYSGRSMQTLHCCCCCFRDAYSTYRKDSVEL